MYRCAIPSCLIIPIELWDSSCSKETEKHQTNDSTMIFNIFPVGVICSFSFSSSLPMAVKYTKTDTTTQK